MNIKVTEEIAFKIAECIKQRLLREQSIIQEKNIEEIISFDEFMTIYIELLRKYNILTKKLSGNQTEKLLESELRLKEFLKKYSSSIIIGNEKIDELTQLITLLISEFGVFIDCKENDFIIGLLKKSKDTLDESLGKDAYKISEIYPIIAKWLLFFDKIGDKLTLQGEIKSDIDGNITIKNHDLIPIMKIKDNEVIYSNIDDSSFKRKSAM